MIVLAAATEMEMRACRTACRNVHSLEFLVTGIGPMESACTVTARLARDFRRIRAVVHFGIGGAYLYPDDSGARVLDLCLAEEEVLGDLGICHRERIEPFSAPELGVRQSYSLDRELLAHARTFLDRENIRYLTGRFVTVGCASGTLRRGEMLAAQHRGLCENMEGAAVVRGCLEFGVPCLEIRCISNLVEDREGSRWELKKACLLAGKAAAAIADHLVEFHIE